MQATEILAGLRRQQKTIDALLGKTEDAIKKHRATSHDGDRVDYTFVGEIVFSQSENAAADIIFTVPEKQDFFARRLAFYPSFRFVTSDKGANGPNEISFRPCIFSSYEGSWNPRVEADPAAVDAFVSLSETFDVGVDAGTPVSNKYKVTNHFPFTGELDKVIVRLTD